MIPRHGVEMELRKAGKPPLLRSSSGVPGSAWQVTSEAHSHREVLNRVGADGVGMKFHFPVKIILQSFALVP